MQNGGNGGNGGNSGNGGIANGMAEWRNGRQNDGMAVAHGLNLQILTAELGFISWLSRVSPAEWRNGGMTEWRNGGMADRHGQWPELFKSNRVRRVAKAASCMFILCSVWSLLCEP